MSRRFVVLAAVVLAGVSACSGSDAATDTAPPASSTDSTVPDTTAAPTTAQSTSTTSTTTSTVVATTSTAPTTTVDPLAQIEADVKQARLDAEAAYFSAAAEPTNVSLREAYRAAYSAEAFADRAAFLDRLLADGASLRSSSDVPKSITFPEPIEIIEDGRVAIQVCRVDSDVIRIAPTETEPEVIIDDRIVTTLSRTEFVLVDGEWILSRGTELGRWENRLTCDD